MRSGKKRSGGGVAGSSDFDSPPENTDEYSDAAAALQQNLEKGKELLLQENEEDFEEDGDEDYEEREEDGERSNYDRVDHLEIDQDGDGEDDGGDEEEEDRADERPKLAEGFYEIEAIRKKRKRKSVIQYLIKWRGWPESANTWEPLKNLQTCYDLIADFEARLKSGKGKRGRKRNSNHGVASQQQSKKKQPKNHSHDIPLVRLRLIEEDPLPVAPPINSLNAVETNVGAVTRRQAAKRGDENGNVLVSSQDEGRDMDLSNNKLSKAKGSRCVNLDNSDYVSVHIQEQPAAEGAARTNGVSDANGHEAGQTGRRIGARRRKPNVVKRFKPNSSSRAVDHANDGTIRTSCINGNQNDGLDSNKVDSPVITEIIKAMEYSVSASDNTQEVAVTFMVMRSDGSEMLASNKFLKAHYPLLLINYYEQHLRYSPPE